MTPMPVGHRERRSDTLSGPWSMATLTALTEDFTMNGLQPLFAGLHGLATHSLSQALLANSLVRNTRPALDRDFPLQGVESAREGHPAQQIRASALPASLVALANAMRADLRDVATATGSPLKPNSDRPDSAVLSAFADRLAGSGEAFAALPKTNGTQRAAPVLCPSALQTLYVCAGPAGFDANPSAAGLRNHPVIMPEARSERAQVCSEVVGSALLGTDGRNSTSAYEVLRSDVAKSVGDTARRWTGKPDLVGKKEWAQVCRVRDPVSTFIQQINQHLHEGRRLLPAQDATGWMLRVALSTGSPMQQAMARNDLPATVAVCSNDWAKLALGIEQIGDGHWGMRHADVMQSARLPVTDTQSFTALATSMHTSLRPHEACRRLRNEMTAQNVPTIKAFGGNDAEENYDYSDV
ncbi:hypothetical protein [Pandoraea sp. PE-S2T-3]|uniref:hypothetical protein n=1 Tax=Pandoraea sp. PE-S2T-3 TaxID=1986993 RepID=UPI0011250482|nr:hypothetical protein [Pandoraea sp. PE-S2T-3]